jgi:predicted nucleic acid-binding Zn ribbon protein
LEQEIKMPEPQRLSVAISEYITRRGFARVQGNAQLQNIWDKIAGERISAKTKVMGLNRGKLEVGLSSSALLNELVSFKRAELLQKMQAEYPEHKINDLKFKLKSDMQK